MTAIRVLLAEDSPTIRLHLRQMIDSAPSLQVIGEARDGQEALMMAETLKPDIISMDIRMPGLDGLEATRQIMAHHPTPIVVVSAMLDDDIDLSFEAIEAGALAVVPKPPARNHSGFAASQRQLISTLIAMSKVSVIRRRTTFMAVQDTGADYHGFAATTTLAKGLSRDPELVAVGASAGGPSALSKLLGELPGDFPVPILIVQHMPDEFIPGLARWLEGHADLPVSIVRDGMVIETGLYLAPGGRHCIVERQGRSLVTRLIKEQNGFRYCPSVDMLFNSVATVCGPSAMGVILTGMGDDGAEGLLALRQAGGRTYAQDQSTSTVFGMPGAALERGGVEYIQPLGQIARSLMKSVKTPRY